MSTSKPDPDACSTKSLSNLSSGSTEAGTNLSRVWPRVPHTLRMRHLPEFLLRRRNQRYKGGLPSRKAGT